MEPVTPTLPDDDVAAIDRLGAIYKELSSELSKMIIGQQRVVELLSIALFSRGHALLMGVPGLAKTLLVSSVAKTLDLSFNRPAGGHAGAPRHRHGPHLHPAPPLFRACHPKPH